jgi:hypothetical protein
MAAGALAFTSFGAAAFGFAALGAEALEDEAFAAGVLRVDVFAAFGETDLDNTDVARDHSFRWCRGADSQRTLMLGMWR